MTALTQKRNTKEEPDDEKSLIKVIDSILSQINLTLQEARSHDKEVARLEGETRLLIEEMKSGLNLKVA
jgi:hypothetical protein